MKGKLDDLDLWDLEYNLAKRACQWAAGSVQ